LLEEYYQKSGDYKEQLAMSLERESIKVDTIVEPFNFITAMDDVLVRRGVKDFLDNRNRWDVAKVCAVFNIGSQKAKVLTKMIEEKMIQMNMPKPEPIKSVKMRVFENTIPEKIMTKKEKDEEISGAKWARM
jgi:hypothetical protein